MDKTYWAIQAVRNRIWAIILDNEDLDIIADNCRSLAFAEIK